MVGLHNSLKKIKKYNLLDTFGSKLYTESCGDSYSHSRKYLFLPVRLLVLVDGRGTVEQADSAARAEL
jgi:hypothetical protein